METSIEKVKFKGQPEMALYITISYSENLFEDTATRVRIVYCKHHLYKETCTVNIGPNSDMKGTKKIELISSNIIEESWDYILNNQ